MNWYSFIFSDERKYRVQRHLLFWLLWWAYFSLSYFHYSQTGLQNIEFEPWDLPFLFKSMLLLVIHIIACYYFTEFLMPRYLFESKYVMISIQVFFLCLFVLLSNYILHKEVFPLINSAFDYTPRVANRYVLWTSITSGILSAPKVICAAAAAKLLKRWWLKQKEKERLLKEKLITDLKLLKAQIHPEFLFSSLENIFLFVEKKDTDRASVVLLKLADILSYMLYDCDNKFVSLEKEIKAIKDYLVLQKIRMGDRLELDIAIKGEPRNIRITPLLLFSFVENCFIYISSQKTENSWMNLEFQIGNNECTMKVIHGKEHETENVTLNSSSFSNAIKRLDFFYPGHYEIKSTEEPEIRMISLRIALDESVKENETFNHLQQQILYASI